MNMKPDCLVCLFNQALRVSKAINCNERCADEILQKIALEISKLSVSQTPPEAAAILYPEISQIVGKEDLYEEKKIESTNKAFEFIDFVKSEINNSPDKIDAALRAAVAGNVIDFATEVMFDIDKEIEKIFHADFAIDDKKLFAQKLKTAKTLLIIGDNAGEHVFDKIMIETIKDIYPDLEVYYAVRGKPIINDITTAEAKAIDLDKVCEIVDSGVDTPGFVYERANEKMKRLYDECDLILAKGMGNFECMEDKKDKRLFFLFKVKCSVVASTIDKNIGDLICLNNI
ncbi:MAG: DUF89 family protein [Epsilonproteobacteria bacterium]|nr:DUF89 family protein [Campylobacterota bacterium]